MSFSIEQMRQVVVALREQHETYLNRVSVSCSTEIMADIMQHLRAMQDLRFAPFSDRCTPCRLLLEYSRLLR